MAAQVKESSRPVAWEAQLTRMINEDHKAFIIAVANVLEKNGSDLELENYDELDDAIHALRFSLTPYDAHSNANDDEEDDD